MPMTKHLRNRFDLRCVSQRACQCFINFGNERYSGKSSDKAINSGICISIDIITVLIYMLALFIIGFVPIHVIDPVNFSLFYFFFTMLNLIISLNYSGRLIELRYRNPAGVYYGMV